VTPDGPDSTEAPVSALAKTTDDFTQERTVIGITVEKVCGASITLVENDLALGAVRGSIMWLKLLTSPT